MISFIRPQNCVVSERLVGGGGGEMMPTAVILLSINGEYQVCVALLFKQYFPHFLPWLPPPARYADLPCMFTAYFPASA